MIYKEVSEKNKIDELLNIEKIKNNELKEKIKLIIKRNSITETNFNKEQQHNYLLKTQ